MDPGLRREDGEKSPALTRPQALMEWERGAVALVKDGPAGRRIAAGEAGP
jgi:hypothetical protein